MAKFKSFTDDSISFLNTNCDDFDKEIRKNQESADWVASYLGEHKMQNTPYEFKFDLLFDFDNPRRYDFENGKKMYETFEEMSLGKAIIFNEKFMVAFALQHGYKYYLSHLINPKEKIKSVNGTLLFESDVRRSMARNIVGRLYLLTALSVDDELEDRFEYTKYVMGHPGLRRMVFYTFVDNQVARLALIKAVKRYEEDFEVTLSTKKLHKVLTHLSCLDNVNMVEIMDEDEVELYLYDYIKELESWWN